MLDAYDVRDQPETTPAPRPNRLNPAEPARGTAYVLAGDDPGDPAGDDADVNHALLFLAAYARSACDGVPVGERALAHLAAA